jgi:hypothetical protein
MISHKTFARTTRMRASKIMEAQEELRAEAQAFASGLGPEALVGFSESAAIVPLGMTATVVSVTVWYRTKGD